MTLPTDQFIRRFLMHVLPKGLHRIRHYGLFANGNRAANIARARDLLAMPPCSKPPEMSNTPAADEPRVLPRPCRCCGGRMIEELHAAQLSGKRLLALWNALPSVEKRKKVGDRGALIDQLWSAMEALPDPDQQSDTKRASKQEAVIAMLQRSEGATVDEVASAMGWQRHTVRGLFSGTLKKKLGLTLASAQEERGRVYRIAPAAQA